MTFKYPETLKLNGSIWYVKAIMTKDDHDPNDTGQFLRTIYNQYVSIRRCLGGQKCMKMRLVEVKERLNDPMQHDMVKKSLKLDDISIETIIYISEHYIRMVK